ncbi:MAG: FTR1 family protein, partial [Cyanobacteriota bacterium]|nr:FTR1 family protein [Cyanobacteriota bacterium]
LVWMTQQAKSLKAEVEGAIAAALQQERSGWGIFALIAIAVAREGLETVAFIAAQFQRGWISPTLGAVSGLGLAALMGFALFRFGIKINIRLFFQVMGVFLLLIVGGLVIGALKHIDTAIALLTQLDPQYSNLCFWGKTACVLGPQVWDLSQTLPDKQFPGILLKTLLGYRQTLFWGQAIAYVAFLGFVGGVYLQSLGVTAAVDPKKEASTG